MATPVDSFIEITGWTNSRESAQQFIESNGGSIETALGVYFEDPQPVPSRPPPSRPTPPHVSSDLPRRSLVEELNDEYTRELVKSKAPRVTPSPDLYILKLPFLLSIAMYPLGKLIDLVTWLLSGQLRQGVLPQAAAEVHFKQNVVPALALRDEAVPDSFLVKSTYLEAIERAKRELKYLLVVLTSDVHEVRPQDYIAQLLATGLPRRDETLVWFGSIARSEGYRVALGFGATQYPFTVLVAASPRTAQSSTIVMEALLNHSGPFTGPEDTRRFVAKADEVIQLHEPKLLALRLERRRFDADRELRGQQDSAYQQSLETDRRRADEAQQREHQDALRSRQLLAWKRRVFARAAFYSKDQPTGARVGIRMPNGQRLTLHFPESAPISDIYDVVYAHLHPDESLPAAEDDYETRDAVGLNGFDAPYAFELKSPVLRKPVVVSEAMVKDEPAVWPNGVLVVDVE